MELRHYARLAPKWLWLLALGTLVAASIGYVASRSQPPVYRASLKLLVSQTQGTNGPDYASLIASEYLARTYAQLMPSGRVLDAAYQKLGLGAEPRTGSATAQVVRDTQLIALSVEDSDPARARDVATAIPEVFVEQRVADQVAQASASQRLLRQQNDSLAGQMSETSRAIEVAKAGGSSTSAELGRLQGTLSQYQLTHAQLIRSEGEIQVANARFADSIRVVEPAELPVAPIRPRVAQDTLLAAIVGLLASLGVAALLERVRGASTKS